MKQYGKGLREYFLAPGVQLTLVLLMLATLGAGAGIQALRGPELPQRVQDGTQVDRPAQVTAPVTVPAKIARSTSRRAELKSIKFFEVDGEIPAIESRRYEARFSPQAKRIFVEVHYKNLNYRFADASIPLVIRYHGPSGALLQELASTSSPRKEYESAITSLGWRPEAGAAWQTGKYTIKVLLDGEPAEDVSFEVR